MPTEILETPRNRLLINDEWLPSDSTTVLPQRAILSSDSVSNSFGRSQFSVVLVNMTRVPPAWAKPTLGAIIKLLELPANWDTCGAAVISPDIVGAAWQLLTETMRNVSPPPSVVPTCRGGLQLEWHRNDMDLEVEFISPYRIEGFFEDQITGESWEDDLTYNQERLTAAIARLSCK